MEIKCTTSDAFFTNVLKAATGNDDVAPCTFAQGLLEEGNNSAVFSFVQAAHLEKCSWGGLSSSKKRNDAALTYLLHIEAGLTTEQALDCIKYEMGVEYHNLAVGYLKFCWMSRLAVQLERKEEIDMVEVIKFTSLVGMEVEDLMKNAEACREGRAKGRAKSIAKFTIKSQLAAMLERGNVDDDVVIEMAARCGMKKDDLLEGAQAFTEGRALGRANFIFSIRIAAGKDMKEYEWECSCCGTKKPGHIDTFRMWCVICSRNRPTTSNRPNANQVWRLIGPVESKSEECKFMYLVILYYCLLYVSCYVLGFLYLPLVHISFS